MEIIKNNNQLNYNKMVNFDDLRIELEEIKSDNTEELFNFLSNLSHQKLIKVMKIVSEIRKRKYKRGKRLLGSLSKALPENLFKSILSDEKDIKMCLAIKVQGILALRVSEVVTIQSCDFDFIENKLIIKNHKCDTLDALPFSDELGREIKKYINLNKNEIKENSNYLFFNSNGSHISKDYLRNRIRNLINSTGMQKKYVSSVDGRKLNLYSSHSLRAYGITKFYNMCGGDIILASMYARHKDIKDTRIYIDRNYKDMKRIIESY